MKQSKRVTDARQKNRKCPKCGKPARQFGSNIFMCIPHEGGCGHMFGSGVSQGGRSVCDSGDGDSTDDEDEQETL
jgi:hypothetical protein